MSQEIAAIISAGLPTQSIGSIAIDNSNGAGPIVYVDTGEGNSGIDSYYGQGLWKTADMGTTWTQVDPGGKFAANGPYQPFTSLAIPCLYMWAGTGFGESDSRGSAAWGEGSPTQTSIYESLNAGANGSWHRVYGAPHPGHGGPVRSFVNGATLVSSVLTPTMFATIDHEGIVAATYSCAGGQPLSGWSSVSIPANSLGRASLAVTGLRFRLNFLGADRGRPIGRTPRAR